MPDGKVAVKFEPHGKTVRVQPGISVRDAAAHAGLTISSPCGGAGTCGKCRVRITEGLGAPSAADFAALSPDEIGKGYRLACRSIASQPLVVEVPETSLLGSDYQILVKVQRSETPSDDPPLSKQVFQVDQPTLEDDAPDVERLQRVLGACTPDMGLLRELPKRLRSAGYAGTAVLSDSRLLDIEAGDTTKQHLAVAFDVGTTTVVGALIDVPSGRQCAVTSRMNPQTGFGDDVLSRIQHAREKEGGLAELHGLMAAALNEMIDELLAYSGQGRDRIYTVTLAGNTTMQLLAAGIDPGPLGETPFVPAVRQAFTAAASELGVEAHRRAEAFVFPVVGGFVGGDTVAGILVSGLTESDETAMLVDIGTNGEIVLFHDGKIEAASCAAGPAFEGARITYGMRAAAGAIERIDVGDDVAFSVIGGVKPSGICGSALIDVVAGLLRLGLITPEGLLLTRETAPDTTPPALRERLVDNENGPEFVIVPADESQTGEPVALTHRDVRELQLATAAIRAGISILLKRADIPEERLERLLVAGGFGNYLQRENAQRLGLLPRGVDPGRFAFIGNASLAGAQFTATSRQARIQADAIAARTVHVDLSLDLDFQNEYVLAMMFPPE